MPDPIWLRNCFNCMAPLDRPDAVCGKCGWDNHDRTNGETRLEQQVLGGQYILGRALGAGGFGITYAGLDIGLERRVAIKEYFPRETAYRESDGATVRPRTGCSECFYHHLESALEEGRTLAKMDHIPNVVRIYSVLKANHTIYIIMEFIDGLSLEAMMAQRKRMPWGMALSMLLPVMRALEKVHAQGVIHRDIKPSNLMWKREPGELVLLDFGAARSISSDGMSVVLTEGYAPVEQYSRDSAQDGRVDEFALCATMYHTITGKRPLSVTARLANVATLEPPGRLGIDMPPSVEAVMMKGLSLSASDRYPSMAALRLAFEAAQRDLMPKRAEQKETVTNRILLAPPPEKTADGTAKISGNRPIFRKTDRTLRLENDLILTVEIHDFYRYKLFRNAAVAAGGSHTVGLKCNGLVVAVGSNNTGQCDVSGWCDIVAVAAGDSHTVALKRNGSVVAVGSNFYCQCDVRKWSDIIAVAAGGSHTVGLKSDGSVVAVGNNGSLQCAVSGWFNIFAIAAGGYHTVGLKNDGTVFAVGNNGARQCNVRGWYDIVAIVAGGYHTVGLKRDGSVVAVGNNGAHQCEVSGWSDIIAIAAGSYHTVGLKRDGSVVAVGYNRNSQCNVHGWSDIVAIAAGYMHTVGLKRDGSVVATGANGSDQCNVSRWSGIRVAEINSNRQ